MAGYSAIDTRIKRKAQEIEEQKALRPAQPWPDADLAPDRTEKRVAKVQKDFWFFVAHYFDQDDFQDYAKPGEFHKDLAKTCDLPGVHIVHGPRDMAKTTTVKLNFVWQFLTGRLRVGGTLSHTMPTSSNILDDIREILQENPRIVHDFQIEFQEANDLQFQFWSRRLKHFCYCAAFSTGRSVRGYQKRFFRPEKILADDMQTLKSPMGADHVTELIELIAESYKSCVKGRATLIALGNNFDTRCYINVLKKRQDKKLLADHWHVYIYPAWDAIKGSLWPSRYPASSEEEMKRTWQASNEKDWRGNGQGDPIESDGEIFPRKHYAEYIEIPPDARGVSWVDPNLSLKEKGDTTAMGGLLFSPETCKFYARDLYGKSYSDSNNLLDDYFDVKKKDIYAMGFDGNVSQEASWTNHVRNWCRNNEHPFPRLEYRRYNVDLLTKNAQSAYAAGEILFPPGFLETENGQRFMAQIFAFAGKKAGKKDDAADWLISAFELIHERGLTTPKSQNTEPVIVVPDETMF